MAEQQSRHEREETARREALRTLGRLGSESETIGSSTVARMAKRASDHFSAKDALADSKNDAIELWGRRIGRGLSLVAFVALVIYLYLTYFSRA
jgi:hypothetical protein